MIKNDKSSSPYLETIPIVNLSSSILHRESNNDNNNDYIIEYLREHSFTIEELDLFSLDNMHKLFNVRKICFLDNKGINSLGNLIILDQETRNDESSPQSLNNLLIPRNPPLSPIHIIMDNQEIRYNKLSLPIPNLDDASDGEKTVSNSTSIPLSN